MEKLRPRIAVLSGPMGTIENTAALVTSNKARIRYGLEPHSGTLYDALRPQRLAAPVTVYVEQFSAHPLERDAADLYAEPDGYVDGGGTFHRDRRDPSDVPVYAVELRAEDGLYPLPYAARQADGSPWDADCATPGAGPEHCRQPFYPDASRLIEEIDRFAMGADGRVGRLSAMADLRVHRIAPSGGYRRGLPAAERADGTAADMAPEAPGEDYFPYWPPHLRREPPLAVLDRITDRTSRALASDDYAAAIWLESSVGLEETVYWLGLVLDVSFPVIGVCAPEAPHGVVGNTGDRNLIDAVSYAACRIWADAEGRDRVGPVIISAGEILAARDALKVDARAGGFVTHRGAGVVGNIARTERPHLTYVPTRQFTHRSEVRAATRPPTVSGVRSEAGGIVPIAVSTAGADGQAHPMVTLVKHGRYVRDEHLAVLDRIERNLREYPLAGFVAEGATPYGGVDTPLEGALRRAIFSGMPVVKTGRGAPDGFVTRDTVPLGIAGGDLPGPKARLLLIASLLHFGAPPTAADPDRPTPDEVGAVRRHLDRYQAVFDTH